MTDARPLPRQRPRTRARCTGRNQLVVATQPEECCDGRETAVGSSVTGQVRSPGRPGMARREDRLRFWALIAGGLSSEDAAIRRGGVSAGRDPLVREAGGMPSSDICAIVEAAVWALSAYCRAGRIALSACTGLWSARDRPPTWSSCIDRLARIEAQRGDAKRRSRVSG